MIQRYKVVRKIGSGSEGGVFLCREKETGVEYAIKRIIIRMEDVNYRSIERYEREMQDLLKLRHKNIVSHYQLFFEDMNQEEPHQSDNSTATTENTNNNNNDAGSSSNHYHHHQRNSVNFSSLESEECYCYIVMSYCNAGNLKKILDRRQPIKEEHICLWVKQLAKGLNYLHLNSKVHRDIKPENLLFTTTADEPAADARHCCKYDKILKIGDFGFTRGLGSSLAKSKVGTLLYASPEVLTGEGHDTSCDIWSFGMIVLSLLLTCTNVAAPGVVCGDTEDQQTCLKLVRSRLNQDRQYRNELYQFFVDNKCHPKLCTLMWECLQVDSYQRPTADEILKFLKSSSDRRFIRNDPRKQVQKSSFMTMKSFAKTFDDRTFGTLDRNDSGELPTLLSSSVTDQQASGISVKSLMCIDSEKAMQFWVTQFGEHRQEVLFNTFCGAYQNYDSRLGVIKVRGLKKLLCGESNVITVYDFGHAVDKFGFPFPKQLLEKMERFTSIESEDYNLYVELSDSEYAATRRKYLDMITKLDTFVVDPILKTPIQIENDCIPLQIVRDSSGNSWMDLEFDMDAEHDKVLLQNRRGTSATAGVVHASKNNNPGDEHDAIRFIMEMKQSHRLIVLGHAASGKTFLCKAIVYKFAQEALQKSVNPSSNDEDNTFSQQVLIPLFVSAASLTADDSDDVPFELRCIRASGFLYSNDIEQFLLQSFKRREVILIIDGLDEVSSARKKEIQDEIQRLDQVFRGSIAGIIITSRLSGFSFLKNNGSFVMAKILPLTTDQSVAIARKRAPLIADVFERSLLTNANYRELASTPLLCSMMIELLREKKKLPDERGKLYHEAIENIIKIQLKRFRNGELSASASWFEDLFNLLAHIAVQCHLKRTRDFDDSMMIASEFRTQWQQIKPLIDEDHFSLIINVSKQEPKRYRFSHLSFQEYLTAFSWTKQLKAELEKKASTKRRPILFGFSKDIKLDFVDNIVKVNIYDIWFRESFFLLAASLNTEEFLSFALCLLQLSKTGLIDSMVLSMMNERNSKEKEPNVYKIIQEQTETKFKKKIVTQGLLYPCKAVRQIASRCISVFEMPIDFLIPSFLKSFKENSNVSAKYIGEALHSLLLASCASGAQITQHRFTTIIDELLDRFAELPISERFKRVSVLDIIARLTDNQYCPASEHERIINFLLNALFKEPDYHLRMKLGYVLTQLTTGPDDQIASAILEYVFCRDNVTIIAPDQYLTPLVESFPRIISDNIRGNTELINRVMRKIYSSNAYNHSSLALHFIINNDSTPEETKQKVISGLCQSLKTNATRSTKILALESLKFLASPGDYDVVSEILDRFENEVWIVREKCGDALEKLALPSDKLVVDALVKMMHGGDVKYTSRVIRILGRITRQGDEYILGLLQRSLSDPKFDVRIEACYAIGKVSMKNDARIIQCLIMLFAAEENQSVRRAAIEVLGEISDAHPTVIELLLYNISHPDPAFRQSVLKILGHYNVFGASNAPAAVPSTSGLHDNNHYNSRTISKGPTKSSSFLKPSMPPTRSTSSSSIMAVLNETNESKSINSFVHERSISTSEIDLQLRDFNIGTGLGPLHSESEPRYVKQILEELLRAILTETYMPLRKLAARALERIVLFNVSNNNNNGHDRNNNNSSSSSNNSNNNNDAGTISGIVGVTTTARSSSSSTAGSNSATSHMSKEDQKVSEFIDRLLDLLLGYSTSPTSSPQSSSRSPPPFLASSSSSQRMRVYSKIGGGSINSASGDASARPLLCSLVIRIIRHFRKQDPKWNLTPAQIERLKKGKKEALMDIESQFILLEASSFL